MGQVRRLEKNEGTSDLEEVISKNCKFNGGECEVSEAFKNRTDPGSPQIETEKKVWRKEHCGGTRGADLEPQIDFSEVEG